MKVVRTTHRLSKRSLIKVIFCVTILSIIIVKCFYISISMKTVVHMPVRTIVDEDFYFSGCPVNFAEMAELTLKSIPVFSPPKVVHYVWPPLKPFTFRNYLNILSVIRFMLPDKVIFHVTKSCGTICEYATPKPDENGYNHWWQEVRLQIPNLVVKSDIQFKHPSDVISSILADHGGIYVNEDTVITQKISNLANFTFGGAETVISKNSCGTLVEFNMLTQSGAIRCIHLPTELYPFQVWDDPSKFGKLARFLVYGQEKTLQPKKSKTRIPLICHYVFISSGDIEFTTLLSMLSCIFVLRANIYVHGTEKPHGYNWNLLLVNGGRNRITYFYRPLPETVYGKSVENPSHVSDVWRVDILMRYGGIYSDWDVIWVNPVDDLLQYDAVASVDIMDWDPFPEVLNLGAFMATKNSFYLRQLKKSLRFYRDTGKFPLSYFYNACLVPYKVFECYPSSLKLERRLQGICNRGRCHPSWKRDYKVDSIHTNIDWRNGEAYSIHWTYPVPAELETLETLKQTKNITFMTQVARYILDVSSFKAL